MKHDPGSLLLFLGHFHPLLVHLPIGGLVLLGILEGLAGWTRWKNAAQNNQVILCFICAGAAVSAACGWLLAREGGYDPQLLAWHQVLGLGVAAATLITLWLRQVQPSWIYKFSLFATILLLVAASHLGASMTYGRGFLTQYAPAPFRALLGDLIPAEASRKVSALQPDQQTVFAGVIQPILNNRCVSCHGAEKHKAQLRLDTLEALCRGGQDGPVIQPGRAQDSPLVQCLVSGMDADGHMPPEGQPQPTAAEVALISLWINSGASASKRIADLPTDAETRRVLETVSKETANFR